jgi:lambda family phage minor tail protein L
MNFPVLSRFERCPCIYRSQECGYTGDACFDVEGNPTAPENDQCGKDRESCSLRFGNLAHFQG